MDLILLLTSPAKTRDITLAASIKSHLDNIYVGDELAPINEVVTIGRGGDIDMDISMPSKLNHALWALVNDENVSDHFILSDDSAFLTARHDADIPMALAKSGHLNRKGVWTNAMVGTIGYLIEDGRPTFDYETRMPALMNKAYLCAAMSQMLGGMYLPRTLYFNTYHDKPARVEDPVLKQWFYAKEVEQTCVVFEETCFAHPDCIKWIRNTYGSLSPRRSKSKH
jgi:hypothetical protein